MGAKRKNSGFKAPEGYFEGLTDDLMDKLSKETSNLPDKGGFKVPENYFENLPKEIAEKVAKKETGVIRLKPYRKYFYAAASVAAILLLVISLEWKNTVDFTFDDLAETDIEYYLEDNQFGLSSYELAEVILEEDLEINNFLDTEMNDNLDDENIMDYLEDNIEDIDELNLEIDE